jgi:signal transduction histidine kinase
VDLDRIFEPVFQTDRARTRGVDGRAEGSGLGLAIVKKIIQSEGGSVRATAGASGGLTVILGFREADHG